MPVCRTVVPRRLSSWHVFLLSGLLLAAPAAPAHAGPNGGGTLIVHDTGAGYTVAHDSYPSARPADCGSVDAEMPLEVPPGYSGRVWKVYAAFSPGSSPRLKALAFAESFDPGTVTVLAGGPPNPAEDFEIPEFGWPTASGGATAVSFLTLKTDLLSEVYWFGGYADQGQPGLWSTAPHPTQPPVFVDDAIPPGLDPIAGFSSIGFGMAGTTVCPALQQACCLPDGSCQVITPTECAAAGGGFAGGSSCEPNPCQQQLGACCFDSGHCVSMTEAECLNVDEIWLGAYVLCDPNPCVQPPGACCFTDGRCAFVPEIACDPLGGYWLGYTTPCEPNPCLDLGACCLESGACVVCTSEECLARHGWPRGPGTRCDPDPCEGAVVPCCTPEGICLMLDWWICELLHGTPLPESTPCDPNPCPPPAGSCCYPDGSCMFTLQVDCPTGDWHYWSDCEPNPCPQIGACCHRDASCEMLLPAQCDLVWFEGSCEPNPCPTIVGACCLEGGICEVRMLADCPGVFDPFHFCVPNPCIPQPGACCLPSTECRLLTPQECAAQGGAFYGGDCDPIPCTALPVERTTWGKIKQRFRP